MGFEEIIFGPTMLLFVCFAAVVFCSESSDDVNYEDLDVEILRETIHEMRNQATSQPLFREAFDEEIQKMETILRRKESDAGKVSPKSSEVSSQHPKISEDSDDSDVEPDSTGIDLGAQIQRSAA